MKNLYFNFGRAENGGAIFVAGSSSLTVFNSKFAENFAISAGGAIFAHYFQKIFIGEDSLFYDNKALLKQGETILAKISDNSLTIEKSKFIS